MVAIHYLAFPLTKIKFILTDASVTKIATSPTIGDFRRISVTSILFRVAEMLVVKYWRFP